MTVPAILESTASAVSAMAGLLVAVLLSYLGAGLLPVALAACEAVFCAEWLLGIGGKLPCCAGLPILLRGQHFALDKAARIMGMDIKTGAENLDLALPSRGHRPFLPDPGNAGVKVCANNRSSACAVWFVATRRVF